MRTWKAGKWCGCLSAGWFQDGPATDEDKIMLGEWVLAGHHISSTTKPVRIGSLCPVHLLAYRLTGLLLRRT